MLSKAKHNLVIDIQEDDNNNYEHYDHDYLKDNNHDDERLSHKENECN